MASKRHLDHAITVCNGLSLRPQDPRCKTLVCRVRKKDDDNKTGVGAQRGKGIHRTWVAEQEKKKELQGENTGAGAFNGNGTHNEVEVPERPSIDKVGSNGTTHSTSSVSTTSSFLTRHFPKRFFILKSHSEDDLHLSVERGLWATQSHNEPVLDQAYRTSSSVFVIFSANKSGEFFGYAKMAGPILKTRTSRGSISEAESSSGSTSSFSKSSSSHGRKPEPAIPETPDEEAAATTHKGATLRVREATPLISPRGPVSNSPQPMTPAQAVSADPKMDYLRARSVHHNTAPSPGLVEKEVFDTKKYGSLDPTILVGLGNMNVSSSSGGPSGTPDIRVDEASAIKAVADQQIAGSASNDATPDEEGVLRKDTALTPEERNARLETMTADVHDGNEKDDEHKTLQEAMDQGSSKPFKIEWMRVQKLPFYRTRHLRNSFNGNREVKISRDGTEMEPDVGQQLLELFWKDPSQFQPGGMGGQAAASIIQASPMLS